VIVTIDGPAGAGKSSVARELARRLGFRHLDSGALYRALTWLAMSRGEDLSDSVRIAQLLRSSELAATCGPEGMSVSIGGRDATRLIRSPEVTRNIHFVADSADVRREMLPCQRRFADAGDVVAEGRDMGTVVFPEAQVKFYLDATPQERADRRLRELCGKAAGMTRERMIAEIIARDTFDMSRPVSPLRRADDAIVVDSTRLSLDQVIEIMMRRVQETRGH